MFLDKIKDTLEGRKPNWLGVTKNKLTRHPGSKKRSRKGKRRAAAKRARMSRKKNR